jgi:hypothetical protein
VLVVVSPRRRAWFAAASRVLCGWVRAEARAAFLAFLTRGARVFPSKTGFFNEKTILSAVTDQSFCLTDVFIGKNSDAVTEWLNFEKIELPRGVSQMDKTIE